MPKSQQNSECSIALTIWDSEPVASAVGLRDSDYTTKLPEGGLNDFDNRDSPAKTKNREGISRIGLPVNREPELLADILQPQW